MNMSKRKRNQLLIVSFVQFVLVGAEFRRKVPFSNSFIFSSINVDLNGASSTFFIKLRSSSNLFCHLLVFANFYNTLLLFPNPLFVLWKSSSLFAFKKIKHLNLINIFLHRNKKTKFPFCYSKVLISCNTVAYINM